jgi:hypothetical protein
MPHTLISPAMVTSRWSFDFEWNRDPLKVRWPKRSLARCSLVPTHTATAPRVHALLR